MPTPRPGEPTPTQRLLACAEQIAARFELPQADAIRALALEPDPVELRLLTQALLRTAGQELARSRTFVGGFDVALTLARYAMTGATIAYTIRTAATAGSSAAPTEEAWELLTTLTTLLYRRAKEANRTYELVLFYDTLAVAVTEVEPEL